MSVVLTPGRLTIQDDEGHNKRGKGDCGRIKIDFNSHLLKMAKST